MVYKGNTLKVLLEPEKLLNVREDSDEDTNVNELAIGSRVHGRRPSDKSSFGKIGDSNVYKRTRPAGQVFDSRPKLDRFPSGLLLQGAKVDQESDAMVKTAASSKQNSASVKHKSVTGGNDGKLGNPVINSKPSASPAAENVEKEKTHTSESNASDKRETSAGVKSKTLVQKSRQSRSFGGSHGNSVSRQFLSDFGFRSDYRPDTFSGHHQRRGVASAELERQMEAAAERHIRTCQVAGNVKRSSRANLGVQGLRETVSPTHTPTSYFHTMDSPTRSMLRSKTFFRSDTNLDKAEVVPYMIQVRKNVATISKAKTFRRAGRGNDPLPEISGRTILVGEGYNLC